MFPSKAAVTFVAHCWCISHTAATEPTTVDDKALPQMVGIARVDITPDTPIRMNGFLVRKQESIGVRQSIWAKALAIGTGDQSAVIITVDTLGIPADMTREVGRRLQAAMGLDPNRLAITATHTHTGPMINGCAPNIFGEPIPAPEQGRIDRYTQQLTDKLEQLAVTALQDRRPATMHWGIGLVTFAKNRRDKNGPFDHDLPVLVVREPQGPIRAIFVSYACHCVTLSEPRIGGDWAGYAQVQIEKRYPGCVALTSVGCAGDQNPTSGVMNDRADLALAQGEEIAVEVDRLLSGRLRPVNGLIRITNTELQLPLAQPPTRAEFEQLAKEQTPVGYHARVQLAKLDRGQSLRTSVDYRVQSWAFGDSLAMVFLPGEVVSEYGLRIKTELDSRKLWVNAYSNACPCYIPSEQVLAAGGYEGGGAMIYYDQPAKFAAGLEQKILAAVVEPLRGSFPPLVRPGKGPSQRPKAPEQALRTLRTRGELAIDLVAAEPLVVSPVAVDFGPDGKIWVAEMFDYPEGVDGTYEPAGRIRVLSSSQDDGIVDTSTIFLDGIPFPTGVTVWRRGVLVCAAPDILYAEDTDGDGRADVVRKLFSGFGTDNYQARVNGLEYGLDGWLYGACGFFGGSIQSFASDRPLELGNRDFRIRPDQGLIEPAVGPTQQGRVRDCVGNWFGCDNSDLARHYPVAMHYLDRNPLAPAPALSSHVPATPADDRLFPGNPQMQMFKLSGPSGVATAACGLGIYRDRWLGESFHGNLFTCEPVNLVVHRLQLSPQDSTFVGRRAAGEEQHECLTSSDTWFRPVQVRTAPDGSLWVLDMARFVIEHPRWIPPESLDKIDVRAGAGMGRIYRLRPRDKQPPAWPRLSGLSTEQLVSALDSDNGWQRDMAMQMLVWDKDSLHGNASKALRSLLSGSHRPETRLQVLAVLDQRQELTAELVTRALADEHPAVRRHGLRLCEQFAAQPDPDSNTLLASVIKAAQGDEDGQVRLQAACTLGAWPTAEVGAALADLALAHPRDRFLRAAVLSSLSTADAHAFASRLLDSDRESVAVVAPAVLPVALAMASPEQSIDLLGRVATRDPSQPRSAWVWSTLSSFLDRIGRRDDLKERLAGSDVLPMVQRALDNARALIADPQSPEAVRVAAIGTIGSSAWLINAKFISRSAEQDESLLFDHLSPRHSTGLQTAVARALMRRSNVAVAEKLVASWKSFSPAIKIVVLDGLLARPSWSGTLLDGIESGRVDDSEIDAASRRRLLSASDAGLRDRAQKLLAEPGDNDRRAVLASYATVDQLKGDPERGADIFRKNCSTCHRMGESGFAVGPDLQALAHKPVEFFLQEILDPNRNLDSRYMSYSVLTREGRTLSGLLAVETAAAITLRGAEGKEESLERIEIEQLQATQKSLMPDGLEKQIGPQAMADLICFIQNTAAAPPPAETMATGELARDILNDELSQEARQLLVPIAARSPAEVIVAMSANMSRDEQEEYRRIPWIWRVAVAAGKNGDASTLKKVIEVSLPRAGSPLRDWQAVVIGGGVINGLGLRGDWPKQRIAQMLDGDTKLQGRWEELIAAARTMADDDKVRKGTRYDALRIVAMADWPQPREQLLRYLGKDVDPELQMGAVTGLADNDHPDAARLLVDYLPQFAPENRRLAIVALGHGAERRRLLDQLLAGGQVKPEEVPK